MVHKWFPQKSRNEILSQKHSMTGKINPREKPLHFHLRPLVCNGKSDKISMALLRSARKIGGASNEPYSFGDAGKIIIRI